MKKRGKISKEVTLYYINAIVLKNNAKNPKLIVVTEALKNENVDLILIIDLSLC